MAMFSILQLMIILAIFQTVGAMGDCQTHNAICIFNGRIQGTILFRENQGQGFSCRNDHGLKLDIDLEGLDPGNKVTALNFRVKSFAGLGPTCGGMGTDFGPDSRAADLGTFSSSGDRLRLSDVIVQTRGPTLVGDNSLLGRSVAVTIGGGPNGSPQPSSQVLDCCIIGMVKLQSPEGINNNINNNPHTPTTSRLDTPNGAPNNNNNNNTPFPGSSRPSGGGSQLGGGGPFPGGSPPSFRGSVFRSPFDLDSKLDFFDLSGKTSRVHSFSPNSVEQRFKAPEPPRFQDIYGLDTGESPLSGSGYGNTVGPSQGSSLSRLFFQDQDLRDALNLGLTQEEKTIPRESGEEESSRSFHEDRAVDKDPGYNDTMGGSGAGYGQEKSQGDASIVEGDPDSLESPPSGYDDSDALQASSDSSFKSNAPDPQNNNQDVNTAGDQQNNGLQETEQTSSGPGETDTTNNDQ